MFSQPPDLQLQDKTPLMLRNLVLRREMRCKKQPKRQKNHNWIQVPPFPAAKKKIQTLQQKALHWLKVLQSQTEPISRQECKVYSKENKNANVWREGMSSDVDVGSATQPKWEQSPLSDDAM